jgi:hypothetical protein
MMLIAQIILRSLFSHTPSRHNHPDRFGISKSHHRSAGFYTKPLPYLPVHHTSLFDSQYAHRHLADNESHHEVKSLVAANNPGNPYLVYNQPQKLGDYLFWVCNRNGLPGCAVQSDGKHIHSWYMDNFQKKVGPALQLDQQHIANGEVMTYEILASQAETNQRILYANLPMIC